MAPSRLLRIHGPHGIVERGIAAVTARVGAGEARTADAASITDLLRPDVVCAFPDLGFGVMLEIMVRERLGSVPVVNEGGQPIGMVTKLDVVEQLALPPDQLKPLVSDIMMPFAITLGDDATVADAATLMACEDMHHVLVVSNRQLIGVVSTMDVTRWLAASVAREK
ncbi:MAG TPA: CBS domain-containing protein [Kofleriaceae bacterium]|nr:CBS domain-containing protein [Kofleriaceae bacterium]